MCKDHTKLIMQSIKKLLFFVSILFTFGMAVNLAEAISKYLNKNRYCKSIFQMIKLIWIILA